jgi:hypothetical protein
MMAPQVTLKEIVDGWLTCKPEGAKLPDTLYLQVDRGSDMFNKQWLAVLAWWLEEQGLFKKVVMSALPVGHSHDASLQVGFCALTSHPHDRQFQRCVLCFTFSHVRILNVNFVSHCQSVNVALLC